MPSTVASETRSSTPSKPMGTAVSNSMRGHQATGATEEKGQTSVGIPENTIRSTGISSQYDLAAATSRQEIIDVVRSSRLQAVAARLAYLLTLEEDEDAAETPMSSASLRSAVELLLKEQRLAHAEIGVGPLGLVGLDLDLPGGGYIVLQFLNSGLITFSAMGPVPESGERLRLKGTANPDTILCAIRPFMARGSL